MSGRDAYEDEMAFLRRLNFEDDEIARFALALRASLPRAPASELTAAMIPRLAHVARAAGNGASADATTTDVIPAAGPADTARPRRRLALVGRIAIAVALLPLLTAGLAVAGVRLPDAAVSAFESVGVDLPNQTESDHRGVSSDDDDADPGAGGAEGAAGGDEAGAGRDKGAGRADGKGQDQASSHGSSKGNGPPAHSNAGGNGGGSANAHGGNPNAKGGNPNAGGGGSNAGGGNANGGGGSSNRPESPPGGSGGQANSGSAGGQGGGKTK
jgi:hypothetical protein